MSARVYGLVLLLLCRCTLEPSARGASAPPRLVSQNYAGEDGSVFANPTPYDSKLGTSCAFLPTQDGQLRCLPQPSAQLLYADPACESPPFAARLKSCADKPRFALLPRFYQTCSYGPVLVSWSAFYVGASVVPPVTLYTADQGACTGVSAGDYDVFLALPADTSAFVAASLK